MATSYDAIVIGSGQAGPVPRRAAGRGRHADGAGRARAPRRHLRQRRLHPDQDAGRQRARRPRRAPRRRLRRRHRRPGQRRHEGRQGAQGPRRRAVDRRPRRRGCRHAEPDARLGPGALRRRRTRSRSTARRSRRRKIFINVGGRAVLPRWPGIADVPVLTNTSMMALDTLPEHLIIVGGSYIGLEFAQMYRRFGARVTVLEHGDRLIAREDPEVSARGPGDPRARGRRASTSRCSCAKVAPGDGGRGVRIALDAGGTRARARRQPPARRGRPPAEHRRPRPRPRRHRRPTRAASSPSTTSCAPACPASGRSAT